MVRYSSTDQLAMNGVTVGGTKYMFLSANDRVVRARKGQSGVHCIKTVQGEETISTKFQRCERVKDGETDRMHLNIALLSEILPFDHPLSIYCTVKLQSRLQRR